MYETESIFRSPWDEYSLKGDHIIFGATYKDGSKIQRIECAESNHSLYGIPPIIPPFIEQRFC